MVRAMGWGSAMPGWGAGWWGVRWEAGRGQLETKGMVRAQEADRSVQVLTISTCVFGSFTVSF